ncbi:MAG TPA: hypothetical protein VFG89_05220 [Coriobacteriia bacterium]|nr:hypothetical protein [Coriobacteriia bacterium]
MIRFLYGPWDPRYYELLPYLEARGLITIEASRSTYNFKLTPFGIDIANQISGEECFSNLAELTAQVGARLGGLRGGQLKRLVYQTFEEEVGALRLKEEIAHG